MQIVMIIPTIRAIILDINTNIQGQAPAIKTKNMTNIQ